MTEQQLLNLKQEIDDSKESVATLKGQLQYLTKELKDNWGTTVKDAPNKLKTMEAEIAKLTEDISEQSEKLEEELG